MAFRGHKNCLIDAMNAADQGVYRRVRAGLLSFSKAAVREHATQSGVSMLVRHLEDHLGLRLFVRAKWGVRPTAPGKRYYKLCNPIISSLELANRIEQNLAFLLTGPATTLAGLVMVLTFV